MPSQYDLLRSGIYHTGDGRLPISEKVLLTGTVEPRLVYGGPCTFTGYVYTMQGDGSVDFTIWDAGSVDLIGTINEAYRIPKLSTLTGGAPTHHYNHLVRFHQGLVVRLSSEYDVCTITVLRSTAITG